MFYLYCYGLAKCQCFDITVASFSKFVEWYGTIDGIYLQASKM